MDDAALCAALALDLDGNFEQLVVAYQDRLYGFARRLGHPPADAEELAQDTFVRAYRALDGYPRARVETLALRAWLYQIALNAGRNRVRRKRLAETPLEVRREGGWEPADDSQVQPEPAVMQLETRRELAALVAQLPARYRVPLVLRHVEGLPYPEVAAVMGQPLGTVKSNVHRAVQRLRAAISAAPGEQEVCGVGS